MAFSFSCYMHSRCGLVEDVMDGLHQSTFFIGANDNIAAQSYIGAWHCAVEQRVQVHETLQGQNVCCCSAHYVAYRRCCCSRSNQRMCLAVCTPLLLAKCESFLCQSRPKRQIEICSFRLFAHQWCPDLQHRWLTPTQQHHCTDRLLNLLVSLSLFWRRTQLLRSSAFCTSVHTRSHRRSSALCSRCNKSSRSHSVNHVVGYTWLTELLTTATCNVLCSVRRRSATAYKLFVCT